MPTNLDWHSGRDSASGSKGSEAMGAAIIRHLFAYNISSLSSCQMGSGA